MEYSSEHVCIYIYVYERWFLPVNGVPWRELAELNRRVYIYVCVYAKCAHVARDEL